MTMKESSDASTVNKIFLHLQTVKIVNYQNRWSDNRDNNNARSSTRYALTPLPSGLTKTSNARTSTSNVPSIYYAMKLFKIKEAIYDLSSSPNRNHLY